MAATDLVTAREDYLRDGATVLRQVIPLHWIDELSTAVDGLMASGKHGMDFQDTSGRFFGDLFSRLHNPVIDSFVKESGLAALAGSIMGARQVRFFYDQLLVKEPGTAQRTPWHQDLPYWPVSGDQIVSFWVPIDPASPENGVVTYVKGSHRWKRFFPMQAFSDRFKEEMDAEAAQETIYDAPERDGAWGTLGDIRDNPDNYELISWNVEPGDVIIHHALTIHGAPGNASATRRRRALATRWFGDDTRWDDSRPHFMRMFRDNADFPYPALDQDDVIDDPLFPVIWQDEKIAAA